MGRNSIRDRDTDVIDRDRDVIEYCRNSISVIDMEIEM